MSIYHLVNSTLEDLGPETAADVVGGIERIAADARAGIPEAQSILREGDAGRAVDYLARKSDGLDDVIGTAHRNVGPAVKLNRELSAIAFRAGRLAVAKVALNRILAYRPDDVIATLRLAEVYQFEGNYDEALRLNRVVRGRAEKENNKAALASAINNLGALSYELGLPDAEERLKDALALDIELHDQIMEAATRGNLGSLYGRAGRVDESKKELTLARDIFRQHNDSLGEATQESNLAALEHIKNNYANAETHLEAALALYERIPYPERIAFCQVRLALALLRQERFEEAHAVATKALDFYQSENLSGGISDAAQALGNIAAEQERWEEALPHYELSHAMAINSNDKDRIAGAEGNLGLAKSHADQLDTAFEHLQRAQKLYGELNRPQGVAIQLLYMGDVEKKRGNLGSARSLWMQTSEMSKQLGDSELENEAQRRLDEPTE